MGSLQIKIKIRFRYISIYIILVKVLIVDLFNKKTDIILKKIREWNILKFKSVLFSK